MNFIIRFNFAEFAEDLPSGSTVYSAIFSRNIGQKETYIILTSEVAGGTIHTVRLIVDEGDASKDEGLAAARKFRELLTIKGMNCKQGLVFTAGLTEAIHQYGRINTKYSLQRIDEMIAQAKEGGNNE